MSNKKAGNFEIKKQKLVKEILLERKTSFLKEVKDSTFIFDKTIQQSIKTILSKIYLSNPQINHDDFYFFINKSMIPNAACYGNGTFSINLGLFTLIENDDELAFIICHELAHHILKHNDKSINEYIDTYNSKETKHSINKAANQTYGRRAAVSALLKDLEYNFMKQSRGAEIQADSLGFVLFNKTDYNKQASVNALKKLDLSNTMFFKTHADLKQNFDFKEYPFKEVWLSADEKLFNITESANDLKFNKDSLKTHPDIPLRIENLNTNFKFTSTSPNTSELSKLQKKALENSVKIYFDDLRLDLALYQLLSLHEKNEISESEFCISIAYLFKKVYLLKEKHTFGKYVEGVNPFSEEKNINEIRSFLNNLELKNIRKIGYYFCLENESKIKDSVAFQDSFNFFKNLNQN
ncbi:M48 family metallopeptidase [Flavobacterium sp. 5]|uniref:M48 family metallopeptidase n=1 Tax=Flavobacterium sp. 5 TaxID=2035199 RepID=UPI000C2B6C8B|nr:M48 family metallopeptidase [Flavobacterium sp. 5]PKB17337.1 peptidase M48-like protein [Flavobacterium sp. 5]